MSLLGVLLVSLTIFRTTADPNDEACLTQLSQSLKDPLKLLVNWTKASFETPCNSITSPLSGVVCNNGRVSKLSMSNMALQGTLSPFLSNCTNLESLDLSMNSLSGSIPPDLQYLKIIAVLNLSSNKLQGEIPPQLSNCMYITGIDLHNNDLSGQIPQELGLLVRLSAFDVSSNKLSGPIPASLGNRTGVFAKFNASSFEGNKKLYGYPLDSENGKALSVLAIVGIGLGSGLVSLVISFGGVCIWLRYREQKTARENGNCDQLVPDY